MPLKNDDFSQVFFRASALVWGIIRKSDHKLEPLQTWKCFKPESIIIPDKSLTYINKLRVISLHCGFCCNWNIQSGLWQDYNAYNARGILNKLML